MAKKVKVIVVDDSALVRALLFDIFNKDPRTEVVAVAADPYEARELIKSKRPDVMTLDVEMPKMNGIAFLKNLMRLRPMPVVMVSTLTQEGAPATLEALSLGAVDFLPKPKTTGDAGLASYSTVILEKVLAAAGANLSVYEGKKECGVLSSPKSAGKRLRSGAVCAIGASTGGTEAIKDVLTRMPVESPPVVVTQHIPAAFSTSFAQRLDGCCELKVVEAEDNMILKPGNAYLAPGDDHLQVRKSSYGLVCKLSKAPPVNRHRPSVEVLFESVIEACGKKAMGVLLTGMGADGSESLLHMREAGCFTVAQDEATSVVWGMPGMAVKLNAADKVLPLNKVSQAILNWAYDA